MAESSSELQPAAADALLPERSDRLLEFVLGRDLQGATLRGALYLIVIGAILATIAVLVR